MRRFGGFLLILATCSFAGTTLSKPTAASAEQAQDQAARAFPLNSIHSTSPQQHLLRVTAESVLLPTGGKKYKEPHGLFLDNILRKYRGGASDIFLVTGSDLTEAIALTQAILTRDFAPIKEKKDGQREKYWLVGYLGLGTEERPAFALKSVEIVKSRMRLSYAPQPGDGKPALPYLFWIPLGELQPGNYTLELFEVEQKQVIFSRGKKVQ